MSKAFDDFMQQVQQNPQWQQELRSRFGDLSAGVAVGDLAEFAAGKGYRFEATETQGELSDAELSGVTGGARAAYIKFDGVDGESKDTGHKDWSFG